MRESIQDSANLHGKDYVSYLTKTYSRMDEALENQEDGSECKLYDDIFDELQAEPLSIDIRRQVEILLSTGGPATKIVYDLDSENAEFYFQDWYQPWTRAELTGKESDMLNDHVQRTYGGVIENYE
jgi:hypothetical protein